MSKGQNGSILQNYKVIATPGYQRVKTYQYWKITLFSPLTKSVKTFNYHYIPHFFYINSAIHQHKWTLNTPPTIFTKSNKVLIQNAVLWKKLAICTCNNNKCSHEDSKSNSEPHKLQTIQWQIYKLPFTILHTFTTITIRMPVQSHNYLSYNLQWFVGCYLVDKSTAYLVNTPMSAMETRSNGKPDFVTTPQKHYTTFLTYHLTIFPTFLKGGVLTARRKSRKHQCLCLKSLTSGGPTAHNVIRTGNRKFQESPAWQHGWPRRLRPEAHGSHTWFARAAQQHKQNTFSPNFPKKHYAHVEQYSPHSNTIIYNLFTQCTK